MAKVKTAPIQVQKYLKGMDYPATREELTEHAKQNGATDDIISMLERLKTKKFTRPSDVSKALGESED